MLTWKTTGLSLAIMLAAATAASAQGFGGIGYAATPPGIGYSSGYAPGFAIAGSSGRFSGGLSVGNYYVPGLSFNYGGLPQYYVQPHCVQPHWDYHPATIRRHGNHYHVTPPHYDLHIPGQPRHHHHHH
jgi:hypothetical protein